MLRAQHPCVSILTKATFSWIDYQTLTIGSIKVHLIVD